MKKIIIIILIFTANSQSNYSNLYSHRVNAYATHQPVLQKVAEMTSGPIIEFGCGHGSTPLFDARCKKMKRTLITLEDHEGWLQQFSAKYLGDGYEHDNSGWHKFYFVPGKKNNEDYSHWIDFFKRSSIFNEYSFDLCFIDQAPWLARYETIKFLGHSVKYIILHDCNYFPNKGIFGKVIKQALLKENIPGEFDFRDIFSSFKVYYPLTPWPGHSGPPTLLGSNIISELPDVDYSKY